MKNLNFKNIFRANSDIYYLLLFGILSILFAKVKIVVPGFENASSDPREVFVLIGIVFLTKWYYALILGVMAGLGGATFSLQEAVIMHTVSVPIAWYVFNYLVDKLSNYIKFILIWLIFVFAYYIFMLVPINLISIFFIRDVNYIHTINDFFKIINSIKIEIIFTSVITSLFISFVLVYKKYMENEEKFRNVYNSGHDAIILHDITGKILDVNETMLRMFVLNNKEEALNYSIINDFSSTDNPIKDLRSIWLSVLSGVPQQFVWKAKRPFDNSTFDVQVNLKKLSSDDSAVVLATIRDISEQQKAKNELRENEEKYRLLFESANEAIFLMDNEKFIDCNEQTMKMFDCTKDQIIGKAPHKFSPKFQPDGENSKEKAKKKIELALNGFSQIFEWKHKKYNGTTFDAEVSLNTFKLKDEVKIQAIVRDITIRKKTEEKMRESEETLRGIFESAKDIIFIKDKELKYVKFNSALEKFFNTEKEYILNRRDDDFFDIETSKKIWENDKDVLNGKIVDSFSEEVIDGKKSYFHTIKVPLKDINGKITGICGFARNITDQKLAENELGAERERLAVTLKSIGDGVITTDMDGNVIFLNETAEKLTGWLKKEAEKKKLESIFNIIDENTREKIENLISLLINGSNNKITANRILISRNNEEFNIAYSISTIKDGSNKLIGFVLVFSDMTERLKLEHNMQKVEKLESLGTLAGGIAHDFNNMLSGFFGNLSLAKIHVNESDKIYKYIEMAESALNKATGLTNQLLTFARGGEPIKKVINIKKIIKETAEFSLRGSNISLKINSDENLWKSEADEGQIAQVITNLVINAKQAMPEGGRLELSSFNYNNSNGKSRVIDQGNYVKIVIKDEGIGIPQKHLEKIFDPYFTTKQEGNGLGLATVFSIVSKHQGFIEAKSEPENGAEFIIYLPATENEEEQNVSKKSEVEAEMKNNKAKVLIMDDEDMVREMAGEMVELLGHDVDYSEDGEEAIEKYKLAMENKKPFDIVIMDLTIPGGMGGKEATQNILKIDKTAKVIVSSGYSTDPVVANYRGNGYKAYINKPYLLEDLEKILNKVLSE